MEKKFNYKLYKAILSLTQENLHISLLKFLEKSYGKNRVVEHEDNFIYAVGDIPICLVAHLDTVHKQLPQQIFYDKEEQVIWSPQGSGHDDRAGVYSIMELVKRGLRPHVLFTWNEEVGGIGATEAAQLLTGEGIDFCIELDRRGEKDSVYYDCDNPDFEDYINSFGFETAIGSFSDISLVCPSWGCAGVNLSIGYQNEHTPQEILYVDWMINTIDKVEQILLSKDYDKEKFKYIENKSNYSLDEIEAKLSVICVRKKVNFDLDDTSKNDNIVEEKEVMTYNISNNESTSIPAWISALKNTRDNRK